MQFMHEHHVAHRFVFREVLGCVVRLTGDTATLCL